MAPALQPIYERLGEMLKGPNGFGTAATQIATLFATGS